MTNDKFPMVNSQFRLSPLAAAGLAAPPNNQALDIPGEAPTISAMNPGMACFRQAVAPAQ
jgi:hypothetical protein